MCAWAFSDSFDCYAAIADATNGYWDSGALGSGTMAPGRFAGSQGVVSGLGSNVWLTKTSSVNDAVHHITIALMQSATFGTSTLGVYLQLLDGATGQCAIVFNRNGTITLASGTPAGTTLATYASAFTTVSTWYQFEFEIIISNTVGRFRVRKNGNPADDFDSGAVLNTRVSANNYANKLVIGQQTTISSQTVDDLYWRSDASSVPWLGDIRCYTRMPASDAAVQFSRTPTGVLTQTVPTTAPSNAAAVNNIAHYTSVTAAYSGTVTGVSVPVAVVGTAVNIKCAIYADNAGVPGAVLASATAPVTPVIVGSHAFTFSPGVSVVQGAKYWIAAVVDGTISTSYPCFNVSNNILGATSSTSYASFPQSNPVVSNPALFTQKSWTYTATPANWQAVAEAQQDATTSYVYDSVVGHQDLYGIAAIASTPLTTFAVTTRAYAIKSDAGTRTMAVQLKSGGTTVASPTLVLTTSNWQWAWRHDTLDPATSGAWTAAAVNTINVGPLVVA